MCGLCSDVNLSHNFLESTRGFEACVSLRVLDLSYNNIAVIEGLEGLNSLEHLDLTENCLRKPDNIRPLSLNSSLTSVRFVGNPLCQGREDNKFRALMLHLLPNVSLLNGLRCVKIF